MISDSEWRYLLDSYEAYSSWFPQFLTLPISCMPHCMGRAEEIYYQMCGSFYETLYSGNPSILFQNMNTCSICLGCPHIGNPACSIMGTLFKELTKHSPEELAHAYKRHNLLEMML